MSHKPPHLEEEEESIERPLQKNFGGIGAQGPSKYGKGGAKTHKAKKRSERAKK